jgi:hypothetical protein
LTVGEKSTAPKPAKKRNSKANASTISSIAFPESTALPMETASFNDDEMGEFNLLGDDAFDFDFSGGDIGSGGLDESAWLK